MSNERVMLDLECPNCDHITQVDVNVAGLSMWQRGELIQNALPELNADEREALMTGICSDCWDAMFSED